MNINEINPVGITLGPLHISQSILISWLLVLIIFLFCLLVTRKASLKPGKLQTALEAIITTLYQAIEEVLPEDAQIVFPFIATLWIFILCANLIGLVPGLYSPTADLSVTTCLAFLTFLSVHWFGIRIEGFKSYFQHYIKPNAFLLPFYLISEISRTVALAIRLFGNIMSLELTALIVLGVAGFLVPVPILMLHVVEAVIQAYIFGMLALIYIAGGLHAHRSRKEKE
jgi:F-type H+-transporting ATPase subunit a